MTIIELYTKILESLGLEVDDQGLVSMVVGDQKSPCSVSGKRLAVPTRERLRSGDWEGLIAFHPLSENVARGVSPVLKKLTALVRYRLNEVIAILMTELMEIAADRDYHPKIKPTQGEILELLSEVDAKTVKGLETLLDAISTDSNQSLISVYLKRGGTWRAEKYSRLAVTSFPILEEFESDAPTIFGKKLSRKKDKKAIAALFHWLLPGADNYETYSYGSNSMVAPYFHSLCMAYAQVAVQLNKISKKYRKHLDNPDHVIIGLDWLEHMDELSVYRDLIPVLEGNDGTVIDKEKIGKELEFDQFKGQSPTDDNEEETPYEVAKGAPVVGGFSSGSKSAKKETDDEIPHTKDGKLDFVEMMRARQQPRVSWGAGAPASSGFNFGASQPNNPFGYAGYSRGVPETAASSFGGFGGGMDNRPPWETGPSSGFGGGVGPFGPFGGGSSI